MGLEANSARHHPEIAPTAYVHPSAIVIGRVCVGDRAFVGPYAVIRADETGPDGTVEPIVISECANIQDCAVIHALGGTGVTIGPRASVAHAAVVHGPCEIGAGCFVGFNSVVFRATLGSEVVILHQALVEGVAIPSGCMVSSGGRVTCDEDVRQLKRTTPELTEFAARVVQANVQLVESTLKARQAVFQIHSTGFVPFLVRRLRGLRFARASAASEHDLQDSGGITETESMSTG
jgi:carbonic anhydrase/acetyltransferase-like protein (isoleucine patch superfamily)